MRRTWYGWVVAAACLLMVACGASTSVKTMWASPEVPPSKQFKKIFVAGAYNSQATGLAFETEMKKQFAAKGIEAGGWLDSLPFGQDVLRSELETYVRAHGFQAVLVSKLTNKETQVDINQSTTYMGGYHGWYGGGVVSSGGSVTTYDVLTIESSLFQVSDEKLIWAGTSEVFAPEDVMDFIATFSPAIVNELSKKGYLATAQ